MITDSKIRVFMTQLFLTLQVETLSVRAYNAHDEKEAKYSKYYDVDRFLDFSDVCNKINSLGDTDVAVEVVITFKHEVFRDWHFSKVYHGVDSEDVFKNIIGLVADYQYDNFRYTWSKEYFIIINNIRANYLHIKVVDDDFINKCEQYIDDEYLDDLLNNYTNPFDDMD